LNAKQRFFSHSDKMSIFGGLEKSQPLFRETATSFPVQDYWTDLNFSMSARIADSGLPDILHAYFFVLRVE